jgi:hypothetical protein
MRSVVVLRLSLVAVLALATGCSSNKGKIEGTKWTSQAATVKGKPVTTGFVQLEFTKDGKVTLKRDTDTFTGSYSLGMSSTVTLHLDQELSGSKIHAEKIVITGDTLTMTDYDGTQIFFQRAK